MVMWHFYPPPYLNLKRRLLSKGRWANFAYLADRVYHGNQPAHMIGVVVLALMSAVLLGCDVS